MANNTNFTRAASLHHRNSGDQKDGLHALPKVVDLFVNEVCSDHWKQDGGTLCNDLYREGDVLQHFVARPRRRVICKRKERKRCERRTKKTDNPRHIVLVSAFPFRPGTLYEE